jgi:hypothetical protein
MAPFSHYGDNPSLRDRREKTKKEKNIMITRIRFFLFVIAVVVLAACSAEGGKEIEDSNRGALRVALEYQNDAGVTYYLRDARLEIIGQEKTSIDVGDDPVLQCSLAPGDYTLELDTGWRIERDEAGDLQTVDAQLLSPNPASFSIVSGQETTFALRFLVAGEKIAFEPGELTVTMQVDVADGGLDAVAERDDGQHLVINEVDYDQPGTDDFEFVEIYNPTNSPVSTEGLVLELINGSDSAAKAYATFDLTSVKGPIPAGGYLVIGSEGVVQTLPEGILSSQLTKSIQNGDPDGIRLSNSSGVIDSLSYGGTMEGITEGTSAPTDKGEGSIARCENGADSDNNASDFRLVKEVTPGAENSCSSSE